MPALHITRPDAGGQPVLAVISETDRFLLSIEWRNVAYRPKDFLFHAPRRFREPGIDCGLHVKTAVQRVAELRHASTCNRLRAFFTRQTVIRKHLFSVLRGNQGS